MHYLLIIATMFITTLSFADDKTPQPAVAPELDLSRAKMSYPTLSGAQKAFAEFANAVDKSKLSANGKKKYAQLEASLSSFSPTIVTKKTYLKNWMKAVNKKVKDGVVIPLLDDEFDPMSDGISQWLDDGADLDEMYDCTLPDFDGYYDELTFYEGDHNVWWNQIYDNTAQKRIGYIAYLKVDVEVKGSYEDDNGDEKSFSANCRVDYGAVVTDENGHLAKVKGMDSWEVDDYLHSAE